MVLRSKLDCYSRRSEKRIIDEKRVLFIERFWRERLRKIRKKVLVIAELKHLTFRKIDRNLLDGY